MSLEWLILILLVPAIVVPVVLLWGFCGCSFDPSGVVTLASPSNLSATPRSTTEIVLNWVYSGTVDVNFEVRRRKEGESDEQEQVFVTPVGITFFWDSLLEEGTDYFYRVNARSENPPDHYSKRSNFVEVSAATWGKAFEAALTAGPPQMDLRRLTMVVRVESKRLQRGGNLVRLTLRGRADHELRLEHMVISEAASQPIFPGAPAPDLYDAATGRVVAESVILPANTSLTLPPLDEPALSYALGADKPLLIAFDIALWSGARVVVTENQQPSVNVRDDAAGMMIIGTAAVGTQGTIIAGPTQAALSGEPNEMWWQVAFDTGLEGWVVERRLALAGNVRFADGVDKSEASTFHLDGVQEANQKDRQPTAVDPTAEPYAREDSIYFLERIDVATEGST